MYTKNLEGCIIGGFVVFIINFISIFSVNLDVLMRR